MNNEKPTIITEFSSYVDPSLLERPGVVFLDEISTSESCTWRELPEGTLFFLQDYISGDRLTFRVKELGKHVTGRYLRFEPKHYRVPEKTRNTEQNDSAAVFA